MIEKDIYHRYNDPYLNFIQWVRESIVLNLFSADAGLFDETLQPLNNDILFSFIDLNFLRKQIITIIEKTFRNYLILSDIKIESIQDRVDIKLYLTINPTEDNPLIDIYGLEPKQNIGLSVTF